MSDAITMDEPREGTGFFGAEQARITEELPPEIWTRIDEFVPGQIGAVM